MTIPPQWAVEKGNTLPVPGAKVHLAENLRAADPRLTDERYDRVQSGG